MEKFKFFISSIIVAITLLIVSCDAGNEPLDPELLNQLIDGVETCVTPTNLETTTLNGGTTINLSWSSTGSATSWQVEYGLSETYIQGAGTKVAANTPTVNIINLLSVNSYTFSVRPICGTGFGDWSEPKNVVGVNPNCANPSTVTVNRSTTNPAEATVNWTAPLTQTSWEIRYGDQGFNPTQGTNTVLTSTKPKLVSGLSNSSYDFYVRAKCSATENSNWVGPINIAAVTVTNPVVDDYWPMTLNNSWTYKKDGVLQTPMKILNTETIDGNLYYKYDNYFGSLGVNSSILSTFWTRKSNNIYYYRLSTTGTGTPSFTIAPYDIIMLKSDLNVNETWTQTVIQVTTYSGLPPVNSEILISGKILEKNISLIVNGISYNNVMKSELKQEVTGSIQPLISTYWFALGVGPIKVIQDNGTTPVNLELNSKIIN